MTKRGVPVPIRLGTVPPTGDRAMRSRHRTPPPRTTPLFLVLSPFPQAPGTDQPHASVTGDAASPPDIRPMVSPCPTPPVDAEDATGDAGPGRAG